MKDVATRAGVSVGTVSRVVNGLPNVDPQLESRVRKAIDELAYRPNAVARTLRLRRSLTLGLVIPDITNPYFAELVGAVESAALDAGYRLIVANSMDSAETEGMHLGALLDYQVDGMILAPTVVTEHMPMPVTIPCVVVDRSLIGDRADVVSSDNRAGGRAAAEHLVQLGHRLFAIITGPPHLSVARDRLAGFVDGLSAAKIRVPEPLMYAGSFDYSSGEEGVAQFIQAGLAPTAILASSDQQAIGALRACIDAGVAVPADVSIVGFDDIPVASLVTPRLTTVTQSISAIGSRAVDLVLKPRGGAHRRRRVVLPVSLTVRESTAKPGTGLPSAGTSRSRRRTRPTKSKEERHAIA
ncbi:MAG: LacI family transcriptional regulator [Chloroflexi bacterium]|nr:LacI family transcriptional regulator [Chloroflexota bacterium]